MADRPDPHRLASRAEAIAPFRAVEVMERAWQMARAGRSIVFLGVGEPDFGSPAAVVRAAQASVTDGRVLYTSSLGVPALRAAISAYYAERFGVDVPSRRIAVTTGASGALLLALAAVLDAGERLLLTDPGYPCNRSFARLFEGRAVGVPVDAGTDFQLTAALVRSAWDETTRGVLLATPSNPTGTIVRPAELAAIADAVDDLGGTLLVDEIYGELVYDAPPATVLAHTDDVFVINSFSKTFGMTGWRLGWLVCPEWSLDALERLAQNLYICPPAPAQAGGVAAFTPEVWAEVEGRREAFRQRRDVLVRGLRELGFGVPVVPQGAFYVYADCSPFGDAQDVARRLLDEGGVAVTPGLDFGTHRAEHHLRFSYATSIQHVQEALDRMAAVLR